jgi:hypothetical protein
MVPNNLVIYVDSVNRAKFFSGFIPYFNKYNIHYYFLTNKLSVYKFLRTNVFLLKNLKSKIINTDYSFLNKSLSVLNNYHSFNDAIQIANDIWKNLENLNINIDMLWIWNGTTTIERAINEFARRKNIKKMFFEISNIENRIFIDPKGISGDSILLDKPEILDNYFYNEEEFINWRKNYENKKKLKNNKLKNNIPFYACLDYIGYKVYNLIREDRRNPILLIKKRFSNNFVKLPFDKVDLNKKYILLPLQVGNDSQIQIYSSYKNKDLVQKALEIARKEKSLLYIKPHPREEDINEIIMLKKILKEKDVFLVNGDLYELIKKAHKIVVNNSTVGLESKIFDKDVLVFGNAYYKYFDKERTRKFIMSYLPKIFYPDLQMEEDFIEIFRRFS